jgi:hypothetical protein
VVRTVVVAATVAVATVVVEPVVAAVVAGVVLRGRVVAAMVGQRGRSGRSSDLGRGRSGAAGGSHALFHGPDLWLTVGEAW